MIEQKEVEGIVNEISEEKTDGDVESQMQENNSSVVEEKIENSPQTNTENTNNALPVNDIDLVSLVQNSEAFTNYLKDLHRYRNKLCFLLTLPGFLVMIASAADPSLVLPFWFATIGSEWFFSCVTFSPDFNILRNDPPLYPVSKEVNPMLQASQATIMAYEQANLEYKGLLLVKFLLVPALYVLSCVFNPEGVVALVYLAMFNYIPDMWCMDVESLSVFFCSAQRILKVAAPMKPEDYPKFLQAQAQLEYPQLIWERDVATQCAELICCEQLPYPQTLDGDFRQEVRRKWRTHHDNYFGRMFWTKLTKTYGLGMVELPTKNGDVENEQESKSPSV